MNQRQFDADGDGEYDPEKYRDFRGNPIRSLFDNPAAGPYEKSHLEHYKPKHPVIDDDLNFEKDRELRREIAAIERERKGRNGQ